MTYKNIAANIDRETLKHLKELWWVMESGQLSQSELNSVIQEN
jgi:hypothetical protein